MSQCREDVYLAGTDLIARRAGGCSVAFFSGTEVCVSLCVSVRIGQLLGCVVFDRREATGDAGGLP